MAMNVTLRSRAGADIVTQDLGSLPAFPEIISFNGGYFVLKRVLPGKDNAFYQEATVHDMGQQGE